MKCTIYAARHVPNLTQNSKPPKHCPVLSNHPIQGSRVDWLHRASRPRPAKSFSSVATLLLKHPCTSPCFPRLAFTVRLPLRTQSQRPCDSCGAQTSASNRMLQLQNGSTPTPKERPLSCLSPVSQRPFSSGSQQSMAIRNLSGAIQSNQPTINTTDRDPSLTSVSHRPSINFTAIRSMSVSTDPSGATVTMLSSMMRVTRPRPSPRHPRTAPTSSNVRVSTYSVQVFT